MEKSQKRSTEILDYRHKGVKRKNNPEEGLAIYLPEDKTSQKYSYDPHLDPQLLWTGKAERTSFEIPTVPLHIHERISLRNLVGVLERNRGHQLRLFDEAEFPLDKRVDFYKHDMDWANRLILGDSLIVMNSLLTKELMAGKVQMIYIDPPYGISYNSNFQPSLGKRDVKDDDESLTREPEQIKAYRDTWELGIHSYLTYLRDRLSLVKELLAESGSCFVQISDANIHLVRILMDEILGPENFCAIIPFRTAISAPSNVSGPVCDYLLWYAKSKERIKFHRLYKEKQPGLEGATLYQWVHLPDGTKRRMTDEEISDISKLQKGSRIFSTTGLENLGATPSGTFGYEFKGRKYHPGVNRHWLTTKEGLDRLAAADRIIVSGESIRYIRYLDDFPVVAIENFWTDTLTGSFTDPKIYSVQTNTKVIIRCILMTTDSGDLVLDPTCGSGTTAVCAERWGRRWITCDTSRVALALAKQRIMTSVFPYFTLLHPQDGVRSGFECKSVRHLTLRSIAQGEPEESEILYDQPLIDASAVRVSGPFTVEAIPAPSVQSAKLPTQESAIVDAENYVSTLVTAVRKSGVIFPKGKKLKLEGIVQVSSSSFLHAEGMTSNGETRRVALSFGARYGPLSARQTEEAIRAATVAGYSLLVLAGFQIDPAAEAFVQRTDMKIEVQFAHINPDMEIHDLLKQTQGSQLFSVFGEPDIDLKRSGTGETYIVKLLGVDIYDPVTGDTEQTSGDTIPAWFLDEDYDGYSFNICQAFFPNGAGGKNPWDKLENALHGIIDKEKVEQLKTTESLPFELGEHETIAVKVFDNRGNEVIKLRKLEGRPKKA